MGLRMPSGKLPKKTMERKFDLEERLIVFASKAIDVAEALPKTFAGTHLAGQLIRCATSPCLQYGEAQGAESRNDFIHKMKISLKELREALNCLRLIKMKNWFSGPKLDSCLDENNQLISIFVKCIETAKKNNELASSAKKKYYRRTLICNLGYSFLLSFTSKFDIPCSIFDIPLSPLIPIPH
jgi:four helix bundle protein